MSGALPLRPDKAPFLLKLRSSAALIVTTVAFAIFTVRPARPPRVQVTDMAAKDVFLYGVVVLVIPFALPNRIAIEGGKVQYWVSVSLAVFSAALVAFSPVWGYVADRYNNKRALMVFGLLLLLGATLLLCFSVNIPMLLMGRILQGMSAALTWTVGLAFLVDSVENNKVGLATGWIASAQTVGTSISPLLGGIVVGQGGYYPVFIMCFGFIAVDIILRLFVIETKDARRWPGVETERTPHGETDLAELTGLAVGESSASALESDDSTQGKQPAYVVRGSTSTQNNARSSIGARGLMLLLSNPRLLAALWGTLVEASIHASFDSTLPLFVSSTFGWGPTAAGLVFLNLALPAFLSPLVGALSDRIGPKWLATGGFLAATPFLICLRFVTEDTLRHKIMLCGLLAGIGLSTTFVMGTLMAEVTWSVQQDSEDPTTVPYSLAYGIYNMAFSCGAILGPVMGGFIQASAGWQSVGWSFAILTCTAAITQAIWTGE
ncbi:major facilitator superfamily protein [Hirsutella rhossiliensis]|uniref:Major facilitator superfamily domain-containing protein n=1 Tax=Hirsutella rhossiliensis TaxID=111463 RepID=A0A9P8SL82_9HYPO|nr:major facilitator superfamily domain-containing protein [Hirsutella rhossiliensis]KAH0965989.1 major facilitator superfamily domain-containing protein [Hirsutella rhossiliensis]